MPKITETKAATVNKKGFAGFPMVKKAKTMNTMKNTIKTISVKVIGLPINVIGTGVGVGLSTS